MKESMKQMWNTLSRKKITSPPAHFIGELRKLSEVDVTCLGLATTLGTGVYTLVAVAAHEHAGPSVVLSILAAAVMACLGGMCYSEVVTRFPKAGSAYSYSYATSGELPAFLIGWGMVLDYSVGTALAAKAFSQHLDVVLDGKLSRLLGQHLGHLNIRGLDEQLDLPSVAAILVIAIILVLSTKFLCSLTNILVVTNFLVISGVVLVGIFNMDSENWIAGRGFFPGGGRGVFSAASLFFYAFVGYDIMALCTIDSPQRARNYPTMVSTLFIVGLMSTFAVGVILTLLVPYSLLETKGSILQAFDLRQVVGMRYFAAVGAISGLLSAVVASLFALIKLLQSLSNDGLLFKFLSRTQCHTLLTSSIVCSFLSCFCDIQALIHVLGMGTIASSIAVSLSVLSLRYGVSSNVRSPSELLELSEESSIGTPKSLEYKTDFFKEKGSMQDIRYKKDYGSLRGRSLSVDFVDESYVTCLSELSPHWTKEEPTHRSAATAAGLVAAAMLVMLLMCVMAIHVPKILPRSKWFIIEMAALVLFSLIVLCWIAICKQPRRVPRIPNRMPCVPFLPLCAVLLDVHLIVELPYMAWITYFIWTLIGTLLYICFGIWNSAERKTRDAQNVNLLSVNEDFNDSDSANQEEGQ